jgi:polysaccharide biosynthesis transport protein
LEDYKTEFEKYYDAFSPLGSQIKRFEREIGVRENEYLELLHSLSLAKLKQQNIEITNTLKIVDEPYYPVHPSSFRSIKLFMLVFVAGLLLGLAIILLLEFMDDSIRTPERALMLTKVNVTGVLPNTGNEANEQNLYFQKAVDFLAQQVAWGHMSTQHNKTGPSTLLVFSTRAQEGKTLLCNKIKAGLEKRGLVVQYHDFASLLERSSVLQPAAKAASAAKAFSSPLDWLRKEHLDISTCDFLIMEIPDVSANPFPTAWLKQFQNALLVVRANRTWKESDRVALENIQKQMLGDMQCVLNGVDDFEIQLWLGVEAIRKNRLFVQRPLWMPKRAVSLNRA